MSNEVTPQDTPQHVDWPEGFDSAPTILLVDDEPNILSSLRRLLRPTGYQTTTASSGEHALESLEHEPVDLIISDMRMPGIDGAQLLDQVRQRWPWTVRILLTGYADISSAISAINHGEIYRYVSKPWNDEEMIMTVRRAIERRGLEKEHKRLQSLTRNQNEELRLLNASLEDKVRERTAALARTNEELSLTHERLKRNFLTTIKIFSSLIDMRIGSIAGHSRRVAEMGRRIAEQMGFTKVAAQDIMLAGLLHDIGKIGFPDTLIIKPTSQIVGDELDMLKKHPIKGSTTLMALDELKTVASLIRHQHERYDGQGFPDGLSGSDISTAAQILAVSIDYDAAQLGLRLPRKLTPEEARDWIMKGKGNRYAPEVIVAFQDLVARQPINEFKERKIISKELSPGMILERDLVTQDGVLLLSSGHILDNALIRQIRDVEIAEKNPLNIWIRCL